VASDSTLENFMGMTRLAVRVMMGDGDGDGSAPVQDEERVFGGRAKEIIVETDPPQKVGLPLRLVLAHCGPCSAGRSAQAAGSARRFCFPAGRPGRANRV
jgi:hypothetical protein